MTRKLEKGKKRGRWKKVLSKGPVGHEGRSPNLSTTKPHRSWNDRGTQRGKRGRRITRRRKSDSLARREGKGNERKSQFHYYDRRPGRKEDIRS